MWMKNEKISLRQYKRLLFFDMVGLGLVLLPDLIAQNAAKQSKLRQSNVVRIEFFTTVLILS